MIVLDNAQLLDQLAVFMLVSIRITALFLAAPFFSAASITVPMRIITTMAIAALMVGAIKAPRIDVFSPAGAVALANEALIGAIIGFMFQMVFSAVSMAGEQISSSMGLGFAAMVDPQTGTQSPVITQFMSVMLLLVFLATEGHHVLLKQLAASFDILPIGSSLTGPKTLLAVVKAAALMFSAAFLVSLPVVVALFLITLTIGMLTRVAPQMNIFSVGFPISITAGIVLILIAVPGFANAMANLLDDAAGRVRMVLLTQAGG